jgi:predicted esterase
MQTTQTLTLGSQRVKQQYLRYLYLLLSLVASGLLYAADESPAENSEKQTDTQEQQAPYKVDSPVAGYNPLTVAGEQFDAAFIEETYGERKGAVVLFHSLGEQFESNGVITPLRHALPKFGWSTLSIALDLPFESNVLLSVSLEKPEKVGEPQQVETLSVISNEQRLSAALAFLKEKEFERILFIGHGQGGNLAFDSIQNNSEEVMALVLISTPEIVRQQEFGLLELPVLDVFGSRDMAGMQQTVAQRKVLMKRNKDTNYTDREIIGANHVYYGLEPMLIATVRGWLKTQFEQQGQN